MKLRAHADIFRLVKDVDAMTYGIVGKSQYMYSIAIYLHAYKYNFMKKKSQGLPYI